MFRFPACMNALSEQDDRAFAASIQADRWWLAALARSLQQVPDIVEKSKILIAESRTLLESTSTNGASDKSF